MLGQAHRPTEQATVLSLTEVMILWDKTVD